MSDLTQKDKHERDRARASRDLHRRVIHISRHALICRDTERLYARQIKTGQVQWRTHYATADNDGPNNGPREETLDKSSAQNQGTSHPNTYPTQETIRGINTRQHACADKGWRPLPDPSLHVYQSKKKKKKERFTDER